MNKLLFLLALSLVLAANAFSERGNSGNFSYYVNSPEFKEFLKKEKNMTEEEKELRKKKYEKESENCRLVCENGIPVAYDGIVKGGNCELLTLDSRARFYKQNKRVSETCGK